MCFDSGRHAGRARRPAEVHDAFSPSAPAKAVGVVLELAAADVFVGEVAADEAVLRFAAGDAADAPERRQEEELVLGVRVLPDQEARALDVVGIAEADQQTIPVRRVGRRARCAASAKR